MIEILKRLVLAVCVGVIVSLVLVLLGVLLISIEATLAVNVGTFLKTYSYAFGVIAAIWYFLTGKPTLTP